MIRTLLLAAGLAAPALAQPAEFIALPSGFQPANISDDGRVVVGKILSGTIPALWTPDGGLQPLRGPGGETIRGTAFAASADGAVIIGTMALDGQVAFRWTAATGMVPLTSERYVSFANGYAVSDDGAIAAGQGSIGQYSPGFVWDAAHGLRNLPFPAGYTTGIVTTISGDGLFAIGSIAGAAETAFVRWDLLTMTSELLTVHDPSGQPVSGAVWGANFDGQVVVGRAMGPAGVRPVIWTSNGIEFLGAGDGDARRVTRDGLVVAGSTLGGPVNAWIWTPGLGVLDLKAYLRDEHGVTLPAGTTLSHVYGLSADGRTITGDGSPSNWVIRLPASRPSDFNRDEFVDFVDLDDFLRCFEGVHLLPVSSADLNHDGITDFFDVIEFLDDFER